MSEYVALDAGWTLRGASPDIVPEPVRGAVVSATVPGCVHTDLLAAGLIPDPFLGRNEQVLGWVSDADWVYSTRLQADLSAYERVDLVCKGLDTVAEVTIDGRLAGETHNMHRSYRFDVAHLVSGDNHLAITFRSPLRYAEAMRDRMGARPGPYPEPFAFIRKMACNFGWDWGPSLATAGIWQPIGLHGWSTARLDVVRPQVSVSADGTGILALHVELERTADTPLTLRASVRGHGVDSVTVVEVAAGATSALVAVEVPEAELWWPRSHGGQPLYQAQLVLADGSAELDAWSRRVGFRTVELVTDEDAEGLSFSFRINGETVVVRGANWIPDDIFVTRIDRERYARRLDDACGAGINLLRVWGGGLYETDDFYDCADERGILVWQDFLFACAAYPEESPLADEVVAEAREQVVRLASHPSLVLWNGNNENIWGYWDWGWQDVLDGRTWGERYYLETLPAIVAELDPTRPYWPGSPYSGDPSIHPNEPSRGPMHIWDVWNERDYTDYRTFAPRFVAEFGFQAPPAMSTLERALEPADLGPYTEGMLVHQKAIDGNLKLERGLENHFGVPDDFDDWHYLTQLNQARALQLGIEHFRSLYPLCTGTIVWQLNDCWPVVSWAAVDGDERRKLLWYGLRNAYADRVVTAQPRGDGLVAVVINDSAQAWQGELTVERVDFDGKVLGCEPIGFTAGARSIVECPLPEGLTTPGDPARELLVASAGGVRGLWFFRRDKDLAYDPAAYDVDVAPGEDATRVTVTARVLLRDLSLFADRVDPEATVDTALVTLLPGESATFTVRHTQRLDEAALTSRPVLRCVNDVLARATDKDTGRRISGEGSTEPVHP